MKYTILAFIALMTGCATQERNPTLCVEWASYYVPVEECVGGRGVAPQICLVEDKLRHYCVRWEEE